jgi:hypothetical protein
LQTIDDEKNDVRGVVVDSDGRPVEGVTITPIGYRQGLSERLGLGQIRGQPTITDRQGEFRLKSTERITGLPVVVGARGNVPLKVTLPAGAEQIVRLSRGVTMRGRLAGERQPCGGVIMAAQNDYENHAFAPGLWETVTDAEGRFTFAHLPTEMKIRFFGRICSTGRCGAISPREVTTTTAETLDLGDIAVAPGHRLKGRVVFSDGRPLPAGLRAQMYRSRLVDVAMTPVLDDGTFEFHSLPDEVLKLAIDAPPAKKGAPAAVDFHLSKKNRSLRHFFELMGRVDADLEITVLLEPGKSDYVPPVLGSDEHTLENEKLRLLLKKTLQGVSSYEPLPQSGH